MVKIIEKLFLNTRQFFHLKGSKKNWIKSKSNSFEILEKEVKRVVGEVIKFPTSQPDFHDVQKNSVFALHRRLGHFFKRESDHYIQKIFETGSVSSAHLFVDDKFNDIVFSRSSEKKFSIEYFLSKFLKIYKISLFNYRYKFYFDALFGNIKNFGDKELSIKIQERKTARLSWYSFLEKNNLIGWSNKPYFYDLYKKYKAESN